MMGIGAFVEDGMLTVHFNMLLMGVLMLYFGIIVLIKMKLDAYQEAREEDEL